MVSSDWDEGGMIDYAALKVEHHGKLMDQGEYCLVSDVIVVLEEAFKAGVVHAKEGGPDLETTLRSILTKEGEIVNYRP